MLQNVKRILLVFAAAGLATGCADYMNHRDTITFGAGNAVEANKAIHIRDPFPPEAQRTHIASDGRVIRRAVTQYQNGGLGVVQPSPAMGADGASNGASATQ
ncbi:hypothetical protein [Rhizobium binae]|uniref:hypothetical protein n=1 Tax=Rhizobium binae TaxID=1138190 RepID=UPI001C8338F2|nr:hypothetical protein [Rhizobium binae]MBX4924298.1 hypothetical protein [Rhizobium binae]